jgi:hypothetical protein
MPPAAAVPLLAEPLAVAIVRNGCAGYWLVTLASDKQTAAAIIAAINLALGVTPAQREALLAGSLFGFNCPAADPASYTAAGAIAR